MSFEHIKKSDRQIYELINAETKRQRETINLIASENFVSENVLTALGSVFVNKYAEGYAKRRYYGGNDFADKLEILCQKRALKLFGLSAKKWHVNVQSYSGSPANLSIYFALAPFGKKIMGMPLDMGGHLTHGQKVSITGKLWKQVPYGVNRKTEQLDYGEILKIAKKEKPAFIIAGATAYSRRIDFKKFREIADRIGAYLVVDMSHIAGLVAGRVHSSPFPYADVVMTTTHKTLRGPRAALIFCKKELAQKIDKAVFPGTQGGPHMNQVAAIAVALKEAIRPSFKKYIRQVVKNAKVLAQELQERGLRIVSGGTDTHLFLVDTQSRGISGKEASEKLEKAGIIVNKNTIPFDNFTPMNPSGIRLGTSFITSLGAKEKEMKRIAEWIHRVLIKKENPELILKEARKLTKKLKPALSF